MEAIKHKLIKSLGFVVLAISMLFITLESLAEAPKFPHGCRQAGFAFKYYVLMLYPRSAGYPQSMYFIHNKTYQTVKLYQMRTGNEPYIMYLNNKIKPNQWGAFAADEKKVRFICTLADKKLKYGRIVDCAKVVELCEYTNVKFSLNNHGNYWAVSSGAKTAVKYIVINQGTLLRW